MTQPRDTRFVLLAPDVPTAKAWCAERRIHDTQAIVVTPKAMSRLRGAPQGLDLVVICREQTAMRDLHVEAMRLIVDDKL